VIRRRSFRIRGVRRMRTKGLQDDQEKDDPERWKEAGKSGER
jgi:hypothetical protein